MEVDLTRRILSKVHQTYDDCGRKNRFPPWMGKYEYSRFMYPTCFSSLSQPFSLNARNKLIRFQIFYRSTTFKALKYDVFGWKKIAPHHREQPRV